ncbi:hypothetical protein NZ698_03580 [Chryseobacterium sp. PBS4-4]|uniref:Lipoprotein n=1 Tax=Chryseobacterium edaphi TaxID=2976532 RepID=A0ABT2W6C6_9FLAO|nr:hypothetical protein [Chryseobacterium edaphi]MCU7616265.1 hypothetical protein [Chryseobacterium edaphi]
MKKYLSLIIVSFFVTSCYTYQRKKQVSVSPEVGQESKKKASENNSAVAQLNNPSVETQNKKSQQPVNEKEVLPINIQNELQPTKNYKIKVDGRSYKIIADKWEGDTLVAHRVNKPEAILKLHKNQINAEAITERRFSKPLSDIITILVYGGIGVGIYMLLR